MLSCYHVKIHRSTPVYRFLYCWYMTSSVFCCAKERSGRQDSSQEQFLQRILGGFRINIWTFLLTSNALKPESTTRASARPRFCLLLCIRDIETSASTAFGKKFLTFHACRVRPASVSSFLIKGRKRRNNSGRLQEVFKEFTA